MKPVLVACGVRREARIAEAVGGVVAVAGGGRADLLEARLEALAPGARGLASFGLCGALDPALAVGDTVIGAEGDQRWIDAALRSAAGATLGPVDADGELAVTVAAKQAIRDATGAVAVDMETHVAARVAARYGLPLLIARIVSDRADQALPPAFARAMRPDGGTDAWAMLASIARHPGQLPHVIGAAADSVRALAALKRLSVLLGPGLGCPDLAQRL